MNRQDIEKLTQCFTDFIKSMKGVVLEDELLRFSIKPSKVGYKIHTSGEVALVISKLTPDQWMKKYMDHQEFVKGLQKMLFIRKDGIEAESECVLFIALSFYIKAIKRIKAEKVAFGKKEIEEKLPEVIPEEKYTIIMNYIKDPYYSKGYFRIGVNIPKIEGLAFPRLKTELKAEKPKELIEEIRRLFKSLTTANRK